MGGKWSGLAYPAYGLFITFLFVALLFPYEKIVQRVLARVDPAGAIQIDFESIGLALPIGLNASGVMVASPPKLPPFHLDRAVIRPSWTFIKLEPGLHFNLREDAGRLNGTFSWRGPHRKFEADWERIGIESLPVAPLVARALEGWVDGEADVSVNLGPPIEITGFIQMRGEKLKLRNYDAGIVKLPGGDLGTLSLQVGFEQSSAVIKEAFLHGKELSAYASGTLAVRNPFQQSQLYAEVYFKPMGSLQAAVTPWVANLLKPDAEGFYKVVLEGPIQALRPRF